MSSRARVSTFLGLDISMFQSGIDKANGLLAAFKRGAKIGGLGGLGGLFGSAAIVQGLRSVLQAARDARDEAKELGIALDAGVASVAAYADRWDQIKETVTDASIAAVSFFTRTGRAIGSALGTGSSDEEVQAYFQNQRDQKQRDIDLKNNRERIQREGAALDEQLSAARRANRMAELSEEQRLVAINEEINALYERRVELLPKSNAAKKVELDIEKKLAEAREIQGQIAKREKDSPSGMKGANTPFGMSVADVAGMRGPGRRSERERLAAEAMRLEQRGRAAEAAGRFNLAASFRDRAAELARRDGFGATSGEVGEVRRSGGSGRSGGDSRPGLTGAGSAAVSDWDARWGAQLAARNAALNARYGGDIKRPASFEAAEKNKKQEDAATKMENAAEKLVEAADMLKEATIEVEVEET